MDLVRRTIELALENTENGGRSFACVISGGGEIVGAPLHGGPPVSLPRP